MAYLQQQTITGAFTPGPKLQCPFCSNSNSKVTDSRSAEDTVRRRRECADCGHRFTTYERIEIAPLQIVKRSGQKQDFQRGKLLSSIRIACARRPISSRTINLIVQDVEKHLLSSGRSELPSIAIGELVSEHLRRLDRVAYVRWTSVYRDFQDLESFEQVLEDLRNLEGQPQDSIQLTLLEQGPNKSPSTGDKANHQSGPNGRKNKSEQF